MKKPILLIIFIITIIIMLSVVRVGLMNKLSTTGIEVEFLQAQLTKYQKENTILDVKILEESSLKNLSLKAKKLGFIEAKNKLYLNNPLPLALR